MDTSERAKERNVAVDGSAVTVRGEEKLLSRQESERSTESQVSACDRVGLFI